MNYFHNGFHDYGVPGWIPSANAITFAIGSVQIGGFDRTWAMREAQSVYRDVPILPGVMASEFQRKDVSEALQHAAWLAWMYLRYGEPIARQVAWIHEQYASDGWPDTLRDFYNNEKGIQIGKLVESRIGPIRTAWFRAGQPESELNAFLKARSHVELPVNLALEGVWALISTTVLRYAIQDKLAILPVTVQTLPSLAAYDPTPYINYILPNARLFWDSPVWYNPVYRGLKPPIRP